MKRAIKLIALLLVLGLFLAGSAQAAQGTIIRFELFTGNTIAASGSLTSAPIDLNRVHPSGFFSFHMIDLTGTGTAKVTFEVSNDDNSDGAAVWVTPAAASDIVTAHTATSGPGGDGNELYTFNPPPARYLRIVITETGTSNTIVPTGTLIIQ